MSSSPESLDREESGRDDIKRTEGLAEGRGENVTLALPPPPPPLPPPPPASAAELAAAKTESSICAARPSGPTPPTPSPSKENGGKEADAANEDDRMLEEEDGVEECFEQPLALCISSFNRTTFLLQMSHWVVLPPHLDSWSYRAL